MTTAAAAEHRLIDASPAVPVVACDRSNQDISVNRKSRHTAMCPMLLFEFFLIGAPTDGLQKVIVDLEQLRKEP